MLVYVIDAKPQQAVEKSHFHLPKAHAVLKGFNGRSAIRHVILPFTDRCGKLVFHVLTGFEVYTTLLERHR